MRGTGGSHGRGRWITWEGKVGHIRGTGGSHERDWWITLEGQVDHMEGTEFITR